MKKLLASAALIALAYGGATQASVLHNGAILNAGEILRSENGIYQLAMQGDGHLVIYRTADGKVIWYSGKYGFTGGRLIMQQDGNLVVYKPGDTVWQNAAWSSRSAGSLNTSIYMKVTNVGNIEVRTTNTVYWSSVPDPAASQAYCYPGQPKTTYLICLRPQRDYRSTSSVEACSHKEAAAITAKFINDGAIMNQCPSP